MFGEKSLGLPFISLLVSLILALSIGILIPTLKKRKFSQGVFIDDEQLVFIRANIRDFFSRVSSLSYSREEATQNPGMREFEKRLQEVNEKLSYLEALEKVRPELRNPLIRDKKSYSFMDELFSIDFYKKIFLDDQKPIEVRARAFLAFCCFVKPYPIATEEIKTIWKRDVFLAHHEDIRGDLIEGYAKLRRGWENDDEVKTYLLQFLYTSDSPRVRAYAIKGLEKFLLDDDVVEMVRHAAKLDPSWQVRKKTENFLKKRETLLKWKKAR